MHLQDQDFLSETSLVQNSALFCHGRFKCDWCASPPFAKSPTRLHPGHVAECMLSFCPVMHTSPRKLCTINRSCFEISSNVQTQGHGESCSEDTSHPTWRTLRAKRNAKSEGKEGTRRFIPFPAPKCTTTSRLSLLQIILLVFVQVSQTPQLFD